MSETRNLERSSALDFVELKKRFDKELTNGQRAEIRRAAKPDDLDFIPAYYRLIRGGRFGEGWQRVVFLMPYAAHSDMAENIGTALGRLNNGRPAVSEMRLFQMVRSEPPNDIVGLKRILQQVGPTVNWDRFGKAVFFWGKNDKRGIIEDYFMAGYKKEVEDER